MKRPSVVQQIKERLCHLNPSPTIILYGSEARGDARPDSDIDLLVLIDKDKVSVEEEKVIYGILSDLSLTTGICINPTILTKKEWENRPLVTPFYLNVLNEGIVL